MLTPHPEYIGVTFNRRTPKTNVKTTIVDMETIVTTSYITGAVNTIYSLIGEWKCGDQIMRGVIPTATVTRAIQEQNIKL